MFSSFSGALVPPFITSPPPQKKSKEAYTHFPNLVISNPPGTLALRRTALNWDTIISRASAVQSHPNVRLSAVIDLILYRCCHLFLPPRVRPTAGWLVETITTSWPLAFHGNFPPPRRHIYTVDCGLTAPSNLTPFTAAWWQTRHRWTQWRRSRRLPPTHQVALFLSCIVAIILFPLIKSNTIPMVTTCTVFSWIKNNPNQIFLGRCCRLGPSWQRKTVFWKTDNFANKNAGQQVPYSS